MSEELMIIIAVFVMWINGMAIGFAMGIRTVFKKGEAMTHSEKTNLELLESALNDLIAAGTLPLVQGRLSILIAREKQRQQEAGAVDWKQMQKDIEQTLKWEKDSPHIVEFVMRQVRYQFRPQSPTSQKEQG